MPHMLPKKRFAPAALVNLTWVLAAALGVWLALAPLDEVIRGMGRIIPQSRTQMIQHLEGGIIDAILVHEGQIVAKGEPLFRIHDQTARTARDEQAIGVNALTFKQARLLAEQNGLAKPEFDAAGAAASPSWHRPSCRCLRRAGTITVGNWIFCNSNSARSVYRPTMPPCR